MAAHLFVIEAPGKRKGLSGVLWRAGLRDVEVLATVGHIGANPDGLKPLAIDENYRELAYRLRPDRERIAAEIGAAARHAKHIYLATDDDQEGDVIARDVLRFCIEEEDRGKAQRVRLKSLTSAEVQAALAAAEPFDELSAARGDARRVLDRMIGSLSSDAGAVGRVQGSMLILLEQLHPVVGVMTYTMPATDGGGDWVAREPVYAGAPTPEAGEVDGRAEPGRREMATLGARPMNHDDILLSASLRTGGSMREVSSAMQQLYERGKMSYPRAKDHAITRESFRRVEALARINGAGFDPSRFRAIRELGGEHAHEAPNPTALDIPVNRDMDQLGFEDQVLVHVVRNLIECGIPCQLETPRLVDLAGLDSAVANLRWHRVVPTGERLWEPEPVEAGFKAWTKEQSLLHFMSRNGLGRPSTVLNHAEKFLSRDLTDDGFNLTAKGKAWCQHVGAIFGHQNIAAMVENYLDDNKKIPSEMVGDMIELCGLNNRGSAFSQTGHDYDQADENDAGYLP